MLGNSVTKLIQITKRRVLMNLKVKSRQRNSVWKMRRQGKF